MQPPAARLQAEGKRVRSRSTQAEARRSSVATHRELFADPHERRCDLCDKLLGHRDEDGGSGLYVWTRGDEVRYEEPPLCAKCGHDVALVATRHWQEEEEEEG